MAPRTRTPFESMLGLRDAMDQLFDTHTLRPEYGLGLNTPTLAQMPLNVYEVNDAVHIEALLPGISEEDVSVAIDRGVLTIGAKRHDARQEGQRWHVNEFGAGAFTRALSLPYPVDPDHVTAQFTNGVLTLTLPKAESAKPRRIPIGGGQQAQLGEGQSQD